MEAGSLGNYIYWIPLLIVVLIVVAIFSKNKRWTIFGVLIIIIGVSCAYLFADSFNKIPAIINDASYQEQEIQEYYENDHDELRSQNDSLEVFYVTSLDEFLNALGDDRIIRITENIAISEGINDMKFDISNFHIDGYNDSGYMEYGNKYYSLNIYEYYATIDTTEDEETVFYKYLEVLRMKSHNIVIRNCVNLVIEGVGYENEKVDFYTGQGDNSVVKFYKVNKLLIKNIDLFHEPETDGGCGEYAPVVVFEKSNMVTIDNCGLNGSGTHGIIAQDGEDFVVKNTRIYNCNSIAINLERIQDFSFLNGSIDNNILSNSIFFLDFSSITVSNTIIKDNSTSSDFVILNSTDFKIDNTSISNNIVGDDFFTSKESVIEMVDSKINSNKGKFSSFLNVDSLVDIAIINVDIKENTNFYLNKDESSLFSDVLKNEFSSMHFGNEEPSVLFIDDKVKVEDLEPFKIRNIYTYPNVEMEGIQDLIFQYNNTTEVLKVNEIQKPSLILFTGQSKPTIVRSLDDFNKVKNKWDVILNEEYKGVLKIKRLKNLVELVEEAISYPATSKSIKSKL